MAAAMSLSWGAAAIRLGMRMVLEDHARQVLWGMAGYAAYAGIVLWLARKAYRNLTPGRFALTLIGGYALLQLALALSLGTGLPWQGDASLLHHYVESLAQNGYSHDNLASLSNAYDYQVWSKRALPFYHGIHLISGSLFPLLIRSFNAAAMVLSAFLTWRIALVLLGPGTAAAALTLNILMPWRTFTHLDLSHHILGALYFMAGVWVLVEWFQPRRPLFARIGLGLAALALMPLMRLEGGIDVVFAAGVLAVLILTAFARTMPARSVAQGFLALLVIPLLGTRFLVGPLETAIDAADQHHFDTGILAWSTRGWSIDTGGQYYGVYEQVDILTPQELKTETMLRTIASQAYYNPVEFAFRQIPVKAAKFFMAGYASGFEEMLAFSHLPHWQLRHAGARSGFLLALLPLSIGGSLILLLWLRRHDAVAFIVPCAVLAGAYVVCGESDPRYSAYLHSYFFIAGGLLITAVARRAWRGRNIADSLKGFIIPLASLIGMAALWVLAVFALRPFFKPHVFWDIRQATVPDNHPIPISSTLAPFELRLGAATNSPSWGLIEIPRTSKSPAVFTFYALPLAGLSASHNTPAIVRQYTPDGSTDFPIHLPARIALPIGREEFCRIELRSTGRTTPFPLMLGYARLEHRPDPAPSQSGRTSKPPASGATEVPDRPADPGRHARSRR